MIFRTLEPSLLELAGQYPVVIVTGPRQVEKLHFSVPSLAASPTLISRGPIYVNLPGATHGAFLQPIRMGLSSMKFSEYQSFSLICNRWLMNAMSQVCSPMCHLSVATLAHQPVKTPSEIT